MQSTQTLRWFWIPWLFLAACDVTKVDKFTKPNGVETYQGTVTVDFNIKDTYPKALATQIVQTANNGTGNQVTIVGLPPAASYFEIIPQKAFDELEERGQVKMDVDDLTPAPLVSGLITRVVDNNTVEIKDFASQSVLAQELELEVTGTLVRTGKFLATPEDKPILISAPAGRLRALLGDVFLKRIVRLSDERTLSEIDDADMVLLYTITFKGQSMTFAY